MDSFSTLEWFGIISGLCSVIALILFFVFLPKENRQLSLFLSSILLVMPLTLLVIREQSWWSPVAILIFLCALAYFSFEYGRAKTSQANHHPEIVNITHTRPDASAWLQEKIRTTSPPIEINAMGVKFNALYRTLKDKGLPKGVKFQIKLLLLKSKSSGSHYKSVLQQSQNADTVVDAYNKMWLDLQDDLDANSFINIEIQGFEFTPSFYVLRINHEMYVGTYLTTTGYDSISFELQNEDGAIFSQFQSYFDTIWKHASSKLDRSTIQSETAVGEERNKAAANELSHQHAAIFEVQLPVLISTVALAYKVRNQASAFLDSTKSSAINTTSIMDLIETHKRIRSSLEEHRLLFPDDIFKILHNQSYHVADFAKLLGQSDENPSLSSPELRRIYLEIDTCCRQFIRAAKNLIYGELDALNEE